MGDLQEPSAKQRPEDIQVKEVGLSDDELKKYKEEGYLVVRGLLDKDEVRRIRGEMIRIIDDWYEEFERTGEEKEAWLEVVNRDPAVKSGQLTPNDRYSSVRRLYRLAVHDDFFAKAAKDEKLSTLFTAILGENVKLLQSMALLKPPGTAEKRWHQDNAYFRLKPIDIVAFWIAIDPTDVENGCMHVEPQSHRQGVATHAVPDNSPSDAGGILYSLVDTPKSSNVVALPMEPGDALVFHGALKHFTPPNKSTRSRYALQLHYAASHCQPTVCPKPDEEGSVNSHSDHSQQDQSQREQTSFDCDPCVEPKYWFFRKAELLVAGEDFGDPHI